MVLRRRNRMRRDASNYRRDRSFTNLRQSLRSMNEEHYSPHFWHYGGRRRHDFRYNTDYNWWLSEFYRNGGENAMTLRSERDTMDRREAEARERTGKEEILRSGNRPIYVHDVDLHIKENSERHHTDKFELTQREEERELVVRRGEYFIMTIILNGPFDNSLYDMTLNFHIGKNPNSEEGTLKSLTVNQDASVPTKPYDWHARMLRRHDNSITMEILTPCTCIIGEWSLSIDTRNKDSRGEKADRYHHPYDISILLNPWCEYDAVYLHQTDLLKEYVLNDSGCVFTGSAEEPSRKPWNFGQFEDGILEICFRLIRKGNDYQYTRRLGDPVEIARMVTHLVNLGDDGDETGVLVGNWSGNYRGGKKPTLWSGSVAILRKYDEGNGEPVKYGQCWVFSGVTTTICRALGLPCKSVTCYGSAHDMDKSTTIDKYFKLKNGNPVLSDELTSDSIWIFHVWNEVYLKRTDLQVQKPKYDGWQVIDATPREMSDGMYACGPCPVKAIKDGDLTPKYDGKFIFAEVNADVVKWLVGESRTIFEVDTESVGKIILTKNPDGKPIQGKHSMPVLDTGPFNVTDQYKYPEGSLEERKAVRDAGMASNENRGMRFEKKMIEINMEKFEDVIIGSDFDLKFHFKNQANNSLHLGAIFVEISAMEYTGEVHKKFVEDEYQGFVLQAGSDLLYPINVEAKKYLPHLENVAEHNMQVTISSHILGYNEMVEKTVQIRLRRPDIDVEVPDRVIIRQPFEASLRIQMPKSMTGYFTECTLTLDGGGFDWTSKPYEFKIGNVDANKTWSFKAKVVPKHKGIQQLMAVFDSKELPDIAGHGDVWVE